MKNPFKKNQEKKEDLTQEVSPSNSFENSLDPSISSKIMAAFEDNQEEEDALTESQEYLNGLDPLENSDSQPNDQKDQFYDKAYSYYSQNNQMVVNDPKGELYAMSNQEINPLTSSPKLESNENNQEIKKLRKEHQNVVTLPNSETYIDSKKLSEIIEEEQIEANVETLQNKLNIDAPVNLDQKSLETLNAKKLVFINRNLKKETFQEAVKSYQASIFEAKRNAINQLRKLHEDTINIDFTESAEATLGDELEELKETFDDKINRFKADEEEKFNQKVEQKEKQQKLDLDQFHTDQVSQMNEFKNTQTEIKEANIATFAKSEEEKYLLDRNTRIDKQAQLELQQAANELDTKKEEIQQELREKVGQESLTFNAWLTKFEEKLEEGLLSSQSQWVQEILSQKKFEEQKRENDLRLDQMQLAREHLKIKEQALQKDQSTTEKTLQQLKEELEELKKKQELANTEPATNPSASRPDAYLMTYLTELNQKVDKLVAPPTEPEKKPKNFLVPFLISLMSFVLVVILGITLFFTMPYLRYKVPGVGFNQTSTSLQSSLPSGSASNHRLTNLSPKEEKTSNQSSEELDGSAEDLKANDEKAGKLRDEGDLEALKKFNASHKSHYGELDQKLLENDIHWIVKHLKEKPVEYLRFLGEDRQSALTLYLYRNYFNKISDDTLIKDK